LKHADRSHVEGVADRSATRALPGCSRLVGGPAEWLQSTIKAQ
jgi:hypothetical protein